MRRTGLTGRVWVIAAAALLMGTPSLANYQYIHYLSRPFGNSPFTPTYQKFDLTALPNNTVSVFVSDSGPSNFGPNDSFGSVLSQIKQAIGAWSTVDGSDLHIGFGGLENQNHISNTAGIDVIFGDVPGVLGFTQVTAAHNPVNGPNGPFFPIVRSVVTLTRDTSQAPGPSYLENFLTTTVHEFGHALGLQHTYTSSAMSMGVVRNTTRTRPLDADDFAGLLVLYGKAGWNANLGSISGRVTTTSGQPIGLASVVAIVPNGSAVSALTDPNGNYRIDGLQPNNYLLYVHPIPPDANVTLPVDGNGQQFAQTVPFFESTFYPGTRDLQAAANAAIQITAGAAVTDRNFSLQTRSSVPVYNLITYTRYDSATRALAATGDTRTTPAFFNSNQAVSTLVAQANLPIPTPLPQSAALLGSFGNAYALTSYGTPPALALYFSTPVFAGTGPRHLVLNFGNDMYVLPDAVTLVQRSAPKVSSVTSNGDGTVTITGAGFGQDSQIYFDGLPSAITAKFSGTDASGAVTVVPPPGASGQISTVTVYNTDGQNSMLLQSSNPPTYTYDNTGSPQITSINSSSLPAGANNLAYSAMIDMTVSGMRLVDGQVTLGFGSNDVTVRRVWVVSPTHLVANVVVASGAAIGASEISVISGFQLAQQPFAFQTQPNNPRLPLIALPILNGDQTQQTIYPGASVSIYGSNLAPNPSALQLTLNDQPVLVRFAGPNQINFDIPLGAQVGPAVLKLNNGLETASVIVPVDNRPPVIQSLTNVSNVPVTAVAAGDVLDVLVTGLDPVAAGNLSRVRVTISGVDMYVNSIAPAGNGQFVIQTIVTQSFAGTQVPVAVVVDGSSSAPALLGVR
jgi:uncharacterized protein (TIGR03437 family)